MTESCRCPPLFMFSPKTVTINPSHTCPNGEDIPMAADGGERVEQLQTTHTKTEE